MQWYRRYHGSCRDPKLEKAARRAGVPRPYAIAAWEAICEVASQAVERGSVHALDSEELAIMIGCETAEAVTLIDGFNAVGLLQADRIAGWDDRQYASDHSTGRVRRHRGKRSAAADDHSNAADETVVKRFRNGPEQSRPDPDQTPSSLHSEGDGPDHARPDPPNAPQGWHLPDVSQPKPDDSNFSPQHGRQHEQHRHHVVEFREPLAPSAGTGPGDGDQPAAWQGWIVDAGDDERARPAARAGRKVHAGSVDDRRPRPTGMLAGAAAVVHRRACVRGSDS